MIVKMNTPKLHSIGLIAVLFLCSTYVTANTHQTKYGSRPAQNIRSEQLMDFAVGRSLFKKLWIAAPSTTKASDGLGPLYNARSCFQCHINAGRGQIPTEDKRAVSIFMRLSIPAQNSAQQYALATQQKNVIAEPNYGTQLQNFAVTGLAGEGELKINYSDVSVTLAGGETIILHKPDYQVIDLSYGDLHPDTMMSPRIAPQLIGMGILNDISQQDILTWSDPDDSNQDGISGKPNYVWSRALKKLMLGRFGYKAAVATLDEQNQRAFVGDIGLSTPLFPQGWGDCSEKQQKCRLAPHGNDTSQDNLEAPKKVIDAVLYYTRNLPIPAQRDSNDADVKAGQQQFAQLGCANCHRPSYLFDKKANKQTNKQINKQTISPYTDMLLHDMGEGLADHRPEAKATGKEWRTAPLWGIGLTEYINGHHYYLHDGRATTLQEAILWHGGEAEQSRNKYRQLNKKSRQTLLTFLGSL